MNHTVRIMVVRTGSQKPGTKFLPDDPRNPHGIGPGSHVPERGHALYRARFVCECGWTMPDATTHRFPADAEKTARLHVPTCENANT